MFLSTNHKPVNTMKLNATHMSSVIASLSLSYEMLKIKIGLTNNIRVVSLGER
jgi:hypothetical protein